MIADRDVQTNAASLNVRAKIHVVQMKLKLKKKWIVTTTNMKVFFAMNHLKKLKPLLGK